MLLKKNKLRVSLVFISNMLNALNVYLRDSVSNFSATLLIAGNAAFLSSLSLVKHLSGRGEGRDTGLARAQRAAAIRARAA